MAKPENVQLHANDHRKVTFQVFGHKVERTLMEKDTVL